MKIPYLIITDRNTGLTAHTEPLHKKIAVLTFRAHWPFDLPDLISSPKTGEVTTTSSAEQAS